MELSNQISKEMLVLGGGRGGGGAGRLEVGGSVFITVIFVSESGDKVRVMGRNCKQIKTDKQNPEK